MSRFPNTSQFHSVSSRVAAAALLAAVLAAATPAQAQGKLEARYAISMTGLSIGKAALTVDVTGDRYVASASGKASGLLSMLVNGEGVVSARGAIKDGRPSGAMFTASIIRDDDNAATSMVIDQGEVKDLRVESSKTAPDRVAVTEAHRRGIVDPVSGMLVPMGGAFDVVGKEACARTLPVFDGRRRYNLRLTFKRMETVKAEKGYAGPAAVCAVAFEPQAGHRASSTLVKYLADSRDIELWLAPVAGTRLLAPFRASVASMVGNLVLQATQFEVVAQTAQKQ